jgi:hypothetical protein
VNWPEIVVSALIGLLLAECFEVCPWLAARIIPVAARLWTRDPERREIYAEAWQAVIDERPGKLLKLASALGFVVGGLLRSAVTFTQRGKISPRQERIIFAYFETTVRIKSLREVPIISFAKVLFPLGYLAMTLRIGLFRQLTRTLKNSIKTMFLYAMADRAQRKLDKSLQELETLHIDLQELEAVRKRARELKTVAADLTAWRTAPRSPQPRSTD